MWMLQAADLIGTLIFAVAGAFRAVKHELDLLGVLVLATVTGVGGGVLRDLLLGTSPSVALRDERYLLACIAGGLLVFIAAPRIARRWDCVAVADAFGLGVFAATGAVHAMAAGMGFIGVAMMAAMTATGGGVIRDVLVCEVPAVLRADFYATAALLGGCTYWVLQRSELGAAAAAVSCAVVTTGLRLLALRYRFGLPRVRRLPASPSAMTRERKEWKR
jgi:uncharacterized membrane protein YeiH